MKKERIGIFGGTFNPIHKGHVKAALEVQKTFLLNKVLMIPSYIPPHKGTPDIVPPSKRLQMVKLAAASYPQFIPSPVEVEAKGKSYSILTLEKLKQQFPDALMFFILGVDAFMEIDTWREYKKVLEQCHFVVISRPGYDLKEAKKLLGGKYAERMVMVSGNTRLRGAMRHPYKIFLLSIDALDIASKDIRKKVKMGESIAGLVVKRVEEYIHKNKLYQ
ncbi:MAG: nicotinate-nucleotide adenylyltransferase [Candidatus Aminicenantes bacterium]|nr:MAG: nicotinate-nucleotide adenylyltransferase [Candidatus Aminicenantes bacterium]